MEELKRRIAMNIKKKLNIKMILAFDIVDMIINAIPDGDYTDSINGLLENLANMEKQELKNKIALRIQEIITNWDTEFTSENKIKDKVEITEIEKLAENIANYIIASKPVANTLTNKTDEHYTDGVNQFLENLGRRYETEIKLSISLRRCSSYTKIKH